MAKLTASDWKQAEQLYIKEGYTFQAIADKFGITKGGIFNKAKKLQWSEKKEIYLNKADKKEIEKYQKSIIKNITKIYNESGVSEQKVNEVDDDILLDLWAKFDLKCLNIANKALDVCNDDLDTLIKFKIDFDKLDDDVKMRLSKHTTMELNQLSSAIEKYQRIGKNAVGEKMKNAENEVNKIEFSIIGKDAKTD